ncbi:MULTISPECIES: ABC transporter ATP-binding protein [Leisingera]|jgi:branched-chain amino acid transport system ATP-binding protein|uniref:ABC transporter ATP-binding protein n=1 Tax=Leisingera aquaemixtae TaxID=1396826 RepID=A0ABY5WGT3_9RHOB|nr:MULTISPECIES: ABC transporter ATP-binding protein [Leisingera]QDI74848.1 ABC transporter ATP-binding protein [Leisingera aquaemixtae]UWQ40680.1 ABC transporter ATP-binding protein [Leisingera aquaemixtae]
MSDPILSLQAVHTDIAQYHILQGVDLEVPRGQVTMLLGRNGVGKTTTLKTIMGQWTAKSGKILYDGQDITRLPVSARARGGIGFVPEDMGIFSDLTVEENMMLGCTSGPLDSARKEWLLGAFPALGTFWNSEAGNLSGGQKQMLSIARAMAEDRQLYLIDEPTKGLAPAIVSTMAQALRELKGQGASILLVEQNFPVAKALGDSAAVMDDGRVIWSGEMAELAGNKDLQERLMGLSMEAH